MDPQLARQRAQVGVIGHVGEEAPPERLVRDEGRATRETGERGGHAADGVVAAAGVELRSRGGQAEKRRSMTAATESGSVGTLRPRVREPRSRANRRGLALRL
jgi:hypothetical protein